LVNTDSGGPTAPKIDSSRKSITITGQFTMKPAPASPRFVVSVMSRDRVGIVRDVTTALTGWRANIEFVSQTVVHHYFTLILIITFPELRDPAAVRELLQGAGQPGELEIGVKLFEPTAEKQAVIPQADRFVLTAIGGDRPGITHQLAVFLAGKGININDLNGATKGDQFLVVAELAVPTRLDLGQLQVDIAAFGEARGLAVTLQHENIFRATNDITAPDPIR
jgi:predicted amino acid-binding ACT domain protein